ncbi:DM4/DM12 family [Popillia japonica]|uniref:DM4/DM12 family n=1 Tax=Popillia japonica TaxID=7064 RepID=A0AAW1MGT5_POPJA
MVIHVRPGNQHEISKRALLFPRSTVLQLTVGLSFLIEFNKKRKVVWDSAYQQNFDLPYNLTNFMPITYYARSSGDIDVSREEFYVYLMNTLDQLELNGEQCLLRAICEVAQTPFHTNKKNSVLEKIAQFVFTPSQCCNFDNKLEQERTLKNSSLTERLLHAQRQCCNFDNKLEQERTLKNSSLTERLLHAQRDGMTSKNCGLIYSKFLFVVFRYCAGDDHKITKRTLLFPATTVLQLTYGIGFPVRFDKQRQVVWNNAYQTNFDLPFNLTNFRVSTYYSRSAGDDIDISRETLYVYIMNTLDKLELNGEECLLRAICESARTPFDTKKSVLERIAQFVFTPLNCCNFDKNLEKERGLDNATLSQNLLLAHSIGLLENGDCNSVYSKCVVSIIDLISRKFYTN